MDEKMDHECAQASKREKSVSNIGTHINICKIKKKNYLCESNNNKTYEKYKKKKTKQKEDFMLASARFRL